MRRLPGVGAEEIVGNDSYGDVSDPIISIPD